MQYVRVEVAEGRAYTYTWDGDLPLEPGERVLLPSNMVQDKVFEGTVLRIMSEPGWDGPLKAILSRVEPTPLPDDPEDYR